MTFEQNSNLKTVLPTEERRRTSSRPKIQCPLFSNLRVIQNKAVDFVKSYENMSLFSEHIWI